MLIVKKNPHKANIYMVHWIWPRAENKEKFYTNKIQG